MKWPLCTAVILFCVTQVSAINLIFTNKDASCGNNNGSIVVDVMNGTPPYNYIWSSGQTTQTIDNLAPGTYTVTVTDQLGSSATDFAIINNTTEITGAGLTYVVPPMGLGLTHPCNGQCNGIAYLSEWSMNGTPPYSVYTSMGHTIGYYAPFNVQTVEGICSPDVYTVYVSDALGCTGTGSPTFTYPFASFDNSQTITGACSGAANGQVEFTLLNSQGIPFNISWTGPTIDSVLGTPGIPTLLMTQLEQGNYTVTMTNAYAVAPCDTVFNINVPALGACGSVSGKVYVDTVSNCLPDLGEPSIPFRIIQFTPGPYYSTTDSTGNYTAELPYGTFSASTISDYYFISVCQASGISLTAINDTITGLDLGDSAVTAFDLSAHLSTGPARPGFNFQMYLSVINHSYTAVPNPEVVIDFDTVLNFTSCNVPFTISGTNQLTLQMPPISGFGSAAAMLNFSIPPDPLLIGLTMVNQAVLDANMPEANTTNNTDIIQQIITGSIDPNEKAVWPAFNAQHTYLADVDTLLRYTIRFQNTGTDTAFKVVLLDTLNQFLDVTSLQMIGSSHPCTWEITGQNVLRVTYENILLPDSNVNEPASHGLFSFTITHLPSILLQPLPYLLENVAAIYFDFNPPIITNAAFNTVDISVGLEEENQTQFHLYPNPVSDDVIIVCDDPASVERILVTDLPGKLVGSWKPAGAKTILPLGGLSPGIYLVAIEGKNSKQVTRLVKY